MDLKNMSSQELQDLRTAVIAEQERRENLERIPDQITELKTRYVELGGDPTNLE